MDHCNDQGAATWPARVDRCSRDLDLVPSVMRASTGSQEAQVFVDESGRRARRVHAAGLLVAALCALWLVALPVGLAGFSSLPAAGHLLTLTRPDQAAGRALKGSAVLDAVADPREASNVHLHCLRVRKCRARII